MAVENIEGLGLPYGIKPVNAVLVQAWSGPYQSLQNAKDTIPEGVRVQTMLIHVLDNVRLYWFKEGITNDDLVPLFSDDIGGGLKIWDNTKEYKEGEAILYESPPGYYSIYVAKEDNTGKIPPDNVGQWGIANDGAFVPINGDANIKDTKSFESVQISQTMNFTAIETGVGIHYIVDKINHILRLNRFPSSTPFDPDNDIVRYYSALSEIEFLWKIKLKEIAVGDSDDEIVLIGSDGEIKKIPFSELTVTTTDTPEEDSEEAFNAGGAYLLKILIDNLDLAVQNLDSDKLNKVFSDLTGQSTALLNDEVVINRLGVAYRTTVSALLDNADTEIFITVTELPATGLPNKIYLVPKTPPEPSNELEEWIWINDAWELIGSVTVDLSNYYDKDEIDGFIGALGSRIDDVEADLSTHETNYSNPHQVDKTQVGLGNVPNVDATNPANISQSSNYRFVTDAEKSTWNGKQNALTFDSIPTSGSANPVTSGGVYDSDLLKLDRTFSNMSGLTSGTNTEYTLTLTPSISSYTSLSLFVVRIHINCGNNPTLNINGIGAKSITFFNNSLVTSGQLIAGYTYLMIYNSPTDSFSVVGLIPQSFFDSRYIINTTSPANQSFNILGSGRIDGGLGLGIAPNTAARETIGANTSSIGQLLLTPSTTDYTGTLPGMFWNNAGEIKFLDSSIVNRALKIYNNELLKGGSGSYALERNQYGDISAVDPIIEGYVYDTDTITELESNTGWLNAEKTLTAGLIRQGQKYYSKITRYQYECVEDDVVIRSPIRDHRACIKTVTIPYTGSSYQDDDLIGGNTVHYVIYAGIMAQNGDGTYTFDGTTGTLTMTVTVGEVLTIAYT